MNPQIFKISALALVQLVILAACTPEASTRYVTKPLYRPARPVLPTIKAKELECLTLPTYQKLYDRQRLTTDYAITLETVIDSTQPDTPADPAHLDKPE